MRKDSGRVIALNGTGPGHGPSPVPPQPPSIVGNKRPYNRGERESAYRLVVMHGNTARAVQRKIGIPEREVMGIVIEELCAEKERQIRNAYRMGRASVIPLRRAA